MATWQAASALSFPKLERTVKRDFWTALKQVRRTIAICRGPGSGLLLRTRSGYAYASTRYSARSARLLHLSVALSTADIALARPCIYR
jgi:hypothetical protein